MKRAPKKMNHRGAETQRGKAATKRTLARISHKFDATDARTPLEMLFLQRPERTGENSQGQRPWKTPAWRPSPERARARRIAQGDFARSYRA